MNRYLVQETFKPEAWSFFLDNPKAAENWTEIFTKNFETMGGRLHGMWFSVENNDLVMVVELPADIDMVTISVTAFSRQFVQAMKTTPLWSVEELPVVLKKVLDVPPPVSSQLDDAPSKEKTAPSSALEVAPGVKQLDLDKSIYDLTEEYPELVEIVAGFGFDKIRSATLRKTAGRTMTFKHGIEMFGLDKGGTFFDALKAAGFVVLD
jgi:uncharacterized protein with GYD domain